ncbi:MAG: PilZ domain-containing protein [Lachnospiraceae bacterium]|nr:PilZ domain-containing protein [Lachnospiraceae bacterium]
MEEKRKHKRTELLSKLVLKRLDGSGVEEVGIEVSDVSKTGVGFTADKALSIGAVYEAYLTIWTKEVLHAFLEIIRIEKVGDKFNYGSIFIGMPEMDAVRIEVYQTVEDETKTIRDLTFLKNVSDIRDVLFLCIKTILKSDIF